MRTAHNKKMFPLFRFDQKTIKYCSIFGIFLLDFYFGFIYNTN